MTAWTDGVTEEHPELTVIMTRWDLCRQEGFIAGQYSFAGSDSAMDATEQEQACGDGSAFHVPSYISPVAVS